MEGPLLLIVHAAATWALVGLIWTVQLVLYPQFRHVREGFRTYHDAHMRGITWVVAPLMGVELITSLLIALLPPVGVDPTEAWVGFGLVVFLWAFTGAVSVPLHGRLEVQARAGAVNAQRTLVHTNWARTLAWTARGGLAALWLARALGVFPPEVAP